jgi:AcrR family transcriptional regulator
VRAAAVVTAESGYTKLSIPTITGAAGVSNQTFYEHFSNARDAFLEAIDILGRRAADRIVGAVESEDTWVESIIAALAEILNYLAENPLLTRLPFIEAIGAGSEGLERVWMLVDGPIALFNPSVLPTGGHTPATCCCRGDSWWHIRGTPARGRRRPDRGVAKSLG